jgi:competence protein ComEC
MQPQKTGYAAGMIECCRLRNSWWSALLALAVGGACSENATVDPLGGAGTAVLVPSESGLAAGAPRLTLTMVDVGQGDGMVLQLPGGAVVAIDGGPMYGGQSGYYDFLSRNIKRVDFALLSHAHSDHYTGLSDALALMPQDCMARAFDPGFDRPDTPGYQYFRTAAGCRYRATGKGMSLSLDPQVDISVLSAATTPYPTADGWGINNTSLVTYIRFGRFAALLTGDSQTEAEKQVYAERMTLPANVMKIGHHGSCNATGTSYLRAVAPTVALISAAAGNDFGHPHCQTLAKLKAQGTHFYRTDVNGTVTVQTDGEHFTVTASRGSADDPSCPRSCGSPSDF